MFETETVGPCLFGLEIEGGRGGGGSPAPPAPSPIGCAPGSLEGYLNELINRLKAAEKLWTI